jgi:glycosyltransferase involved in cell wall biosynthesis
MENMPNVSAVICTVNRPQLVLRAIKSVCAQTYRDLEIVVVLDGPDSATRESLAAVADPRLRVVENPTNVGISNARNIGIREARGEWIAMLDDDDEWLPEKIEKQMELAATLHRDDAVFLTLYYDRHGTQEMIQPRRFPRPGQPVSEYLFCEYLLLGSRETFLQTSTWLVRRKFMIEHPFTPDMRFNEDADWLLHTIHDTNEQLVFVREPLAIFHADENRARLSVRQASAWKMTRQWILQDKHIFTPRARSFILVTICLRSCVESESGIRNCLSILGDCWRCGVVTPTVLWLFLRTAFVFPALRRWAPRKLTMTLAKWSGSSWEGSKR